MLINPQAADMDERWPLPCVDMAYVRATGEWWELVDFFGEVLIGSNNRSVVFFRAAELGLTIFVKH